ncbi:hypothetical protein N9M15_00115 [Bacteroidia bacterium]|nr:hypothetical protein [Bacteroidia bacterium]
MATAILSAKPAKVLALNINDLTLIFDSVRWAVKLEVPHPAARIRIKILYKKLTDMSPFKVAEILAHKNNFSPEQIDNVNKKLLLLDHIINSGKFRFEWLKKINRV